MTDRAVSINTVAAATMWVLAVALVAIDVFSKRNTGDLGIVMSAGAATVTVRGFFCRQFEREQNAFTLGRDYEGFKRMKSVR